MIYTYFCENDIQLFCTLMIGIGFSWFLIAILYCVFDKNVPIYIFYCTIGVAIPSLYLTIVSNFSNRINP